ncbi:hypothetical protein Mal4_05120 [Maioricimonas rarisocia]|uniref:Uncharacterized protein n=1 Tax=Maioricimonas rarisocia TaxID=2528026 RepID=A0A517Z182_9PLAN|nr:hypothetical protein [Maioricimonas rarisocia]QDU36228.1 hypothetical protein Mal4_05120 [Maioricimonas rarisocia]
MSPHLLLYVALLGPDARTAQAPVIVPVPAPWTAESIRDVHAELTWQMARRRTYDPIEVVPDLVALHEALRQPESIRGMAGSEIVRTRDRVGDRLEHARMRLLREQLRARQEQARQIRSVRSRQAGGANAAVAVELARAQQLISLIEQTIEPASWQTNGGKGRMTYFGPLHVLVIRNSPHVHEQIGGTLAR